MTNQSPYVKSNYPRRENDHYPTVDTRCVDGLLHHIKLHKSIDRIIDVCAPSGSSIIDYLVTLGYDAAGVGDAYAERIPGTFIVTNTPYKRNEVGPIMRRQLERVQNYDITGAAFLLRTGFDHAKAYADMFDSPNYYGQVKLRFRPWWTEDRSIAPIHNFVWHIWLRNLSDVPFVPVVLYYTPPYDPKYASKGKAKS